MAHWAAFGRCFHECEAARRWAAHELERTDRRGAHPALVDAAVVHCPMGTLCPRRPLPRQLRDLVAAS